MSINYPTAVKNARLQVVATALDAQTAPGTLELYAGATVFAIETLAKPSATITNGVLSLAGVPITTTVLATGTVTTARLKDGSGTVVADGLTVGTSGTNIIINSTSLVQNQNVTLNSFTITHS